MVHEAQKGAAAGDIAAVVRQVRRLNSLNTLKFELRDQDVKELVAALLSVAFVEGVSTGHQATVFNGLQALLKTAKNRHVDLPPIPWRPFYALLDVRTQLPIGGEAGAGLGRQAGCGGENSVSDAVRHLVPTASWFFPRSAVKEIVELTTPHLSQPGTVACQVAVGILALFLPRWTTLSMLPVGIPAYWMRAWGWIARTPLLSSTWAHLFSVLAHNDRREDGVPSVEVFHTKESALAYLSATAGGEGGGASASGAAGGDSAETDAGTRLVSVLRSIGAIDSASASVSSTATTGKDVLPVGATRTVGPYTVVGTVFRWGDHLPFLFSRTLR